MSVTLNLPPKIEAQLRANAEAQHVAVEEFATQAVQVFISFSTLANSNPNSVNRLLQRIGRLNRNLVYELLPVMQAATILIGLESDDAATRNAAIVDLANSDAQVTALVENEIAQSVAAYDGPEDDLSDWRALDGDPFFFPEENEESLSEVTNP